jgi:hypothetical protein
MNYLAGMRAGVRTRAHSRLCERVPAGVALKFIQSKRAETGRVLLLSSLWSTRPSTSKMCRATRPCPPHPSLPLWRDKHLATLGLVEAKGIKANDTSVRSALYTPMLEMQQSCRIARHALIKILKTPYLFFNFSINTHTHSLSLSCPTQHRMQCANMCSRKEKPSNDSTLRHTHLEVLEHAVSAKVVMLCNAF